MYNHLKKREIHTRPGLGFILIGVALVFLSSGCRDLQKRRIELKQSSGANPDLEDRFGLTNDAQDPTERDKELGYGKWRQKPEADGTDSPNSPNRRKPIGSP
jgi:hypothetical protein